MPPKKPIAVPEAGGPPADPEVTAYRDRMKAAASAWKRHYLDRAVRMIHLYEVDHDWAVNQLTSQTPRRDRVSVAIPYSNARQILAETYPYDPEPVVKALSRTPVPKKRAGVQGMMGMVDLMDPTKGAAQLKGAIQYVKRRSNMSEQAKLAILCGTVTGMGAVEMVAQKTTKVPRYRYLGPGEYLFACNDVVSPYDSPWLAVKVVRPLEDIQEDTSLNGNRKYVQAATLDPNEFPDSQGISYGCYWKLYDKAKDRYLCFPDGQDFKLADKRLTDMYDLKVESDDFACDWPVDFYINEEMLSFPAGLGDLFPIESQVRELDKVRTRQLNHGKRFNRKYLSKKGFLGPDGMNQLKNPDDGTVIEVEQNITETNFMVLQDAPMSPDQYQIDEIIQKDIQLIQPIGPNSLVHGVGQQPDTLGQSQIIESNSNTRLNDKQENVATFYGRLMRHTAQYILQYWKDDQDLLTTGDGTKDSDWMRYDPRSIVGEFEFDVAPESLRDNEAVYRQQLMQALQVMAPLMPAVEQNQGIAILARRFLDTFPTLGRDVDSIIPDSLLEPRQAPGQPPGQPGSQQPQGGPGQPPPGPGQQQPPQGPQQQAQAALVQQLQKDPQEVIDKAQNLPENERTIIMAEINRLMQSQQPLQMSDTAAAAEQESQPPTPVTPNQ